MSVSDRHIRSVALRHIAEAHRKWNCLDGVMAPAMSASIARERLAKIEALTREGHTAEAILLANVGAFYDSTKNIELGKANFNPDEPRTRRTREWTKAGTTDGNRNINLIQYNGKYHDFVLNDLLNALRRQGDKVLKEPRITGINGLTTKPDAIAVGKDAKVPYLLELKTGGDPPLTDNQEAVYPLICKGAHATSFDPRMSEFGFVLGAPLPPIDILVIATSGPGAPMHVIDYCNSIGMR